MHKSRTSLTKTCITAARFLPTVVLSTYLGALAQVAADLDVAVVGRGQLLQDLLPLVGVCVGLLQTAELLVGRLEADHRSRARRRSD